MRTRKFKAIFGNGDSHAETLPTSSYNDAVKAMNELIDSYKFGDFGRILTDAKYLKAIPRVWQELQPDAIALRVLHVQPHNCKRERRIIAKVVMC